MINIYSQACIICLLTTGASYEGSGCVSEVHPSSHLERDRNALDGFTGLPKTHTFHSHLGAIQNLQTSVRRAQRSWGKPTQAWAEYTNAMDMKNLNLCIFILCLEVPIFSTSMEAEKFD